MRVLVVEHTAAEAQTLASGLRTKGFIPFAAESEDDAVSLALHYTFDLIALGIGGLDRNGFSVLRSLHAHRVSTPVMVLSHLRDVEERARQLFLTADAFAIKPVTIDRLVSRMYAVVCRVRGYSQSVIEAGNLSVDLEAHEVVYRGEKIHLTKREYTLFETLFLHKGKTLSRAVLCDHLYEHADVDERAIDMYISRLRKKMKAASRGVDLISSVHRAGYVLHTV